MTTRAGFNSVNEYQVSSLPWVTSSTITGLKYHRFPWVTKYFVFKNSGNNLMKISFSETGLSTSNYFPVDPTGSLRLDVRIKEIFLSGAGGEEYSLFAGLTTIDEREGVRFLTGSFPTNSAFLLLSPLYYTYRRW